MVVDERGRPLPGAFEYPDRGWGERRTTKQSNILPIHNNPATIGAYHYHRKNVALDLESDKIPVVQLEPINSGAR